MSSKQDIFGTEPQQLEVSGGGGTVTLSGDVIGMSNANTVIKIQNVPVSSTAPTLGQSLVFDGTRYTPESQSGGPAIDSDLTMFAMPLVGEVGYISGNKVLSRAKADNLATCIAYGVFLSGTTVVTQGVCNAFFEPGLTLLPNDTVYLSIALEGRVTNVMPTLSGTIQAPIGILKSATGYNMATGSAQPIQFHRQPIFINS